MRTALQAFGVALHGKLAVELGRLLLDDRAFDHFWQRPRRTGLALAFGALGTGAVAAARSLRPKRAGPRWPAAGRGSGCRGW